MNICFWSRMSSARAFALSVKTQKSLQRRGMSPHNLPATFGDNIIVFVGKTGSGKDVALDYVLKTMLRKKKASVVSFCGTAGITSPIPRATSLVATTESLQNAIAVRKAELRRGDNIQDQIWVLNDVTATNINTSNNSGPLSTLCTESRHLRIRIVIMMQYLNCLSQVIKNQASVFVTLQPTQRTNEIVASELGFDKDTVEAATEHGRRRFHPVVYPTNSGGVPLFLKPFPYKK